MMTMMMSMIMMMMIVMRMMMMMMMIVMMMMMLMRTMTSLMMIMMTCSSIVAFYCGSSLMESVLQCLFMWRQVSNTLIDDADMIFLFHLIDCSDFTSLSSSSLSIMLIH